MENRTCKTCNINKPIVDFYRNGKFYKTNCKDCDKKHSAEYKAKNLDKVTVVHNNKYKILLSLFLSICTQSYSE